MTNKDLHNLQKTTTVRLVAIEEHFVTPAIRKAWKEFPEDAQQQDLHLGEIEKRLEDFSNIRLQLMDETGVDVQVLSLTTPGLHNLGDASIPLAKQTNDMLAEVVRNSHDRFQGFASIPTPVPEKASEELGRSIKNLGFKGGMLCGRAREKNLDHKSFWPIFECAESLRAPLFIHPQIPQKAVRDIYYSGFDPLTDQAFSTFGLGWHYEAGIQFLRMILAGVFDRFPDLQIILGHWGEVVLFYLERLSSLGRVAKLQRPVADYMRQNLYVTASGMFSHSYLRRSVEIVGADRIIFSTDYPYQYRPGREARNFLEQTTLSEDDKRKFAYGNWERLISGK